jgi:predicted nucleic acid-binding protein
MQRQTMGNDRYVLDANVFLEYIYDRALKDCSKRIVQDAILRKTQILVPSLLLDEITEVLCGNLDNLKEVELHLKYIERLAKEEILQIIVPNTEVRMKAIDRLLRNGIYDPCHHNI